MKVQEVLLENGNKRYMLLDRNGVRTCGLKLTLDPNVCSPAMIPGVTLAFF